MKLTSDEVKHIARLARLELSEEEIEKFGQQLSDILSQAKMLEEVDTSNVEPIAQITGLRNVTFRTRFSPLAWPISLWDNHPCRFRII